jgi:hypothetical protein
MSSDEARKKLADRFKRALPTGVEFNLDEIKAEEAEIRRNIKDFEE